MVWFRCKADNPMPDFLCGGENRWNTEAASGHRLSGNGGGKAADNAKIRQSGQSQQEYLLRAALGQTIHVVEELKPVLSELRACGRNLNQLTVLAHEGRIQAVHLRETVEALGRTYDAISALLMEKVR